VHRQDGHADRRYHHPERRPRCRKPAFG
jgi:hypothetical protein